MRSAGWILVIGCGAAGPDAAVDLEDAENGPSKPGCSYQDEPVDLDFASGVLVVEDAVDAVAEPRWEEIVWLATGEHSTLEVALVAPTQFRYVTSDDGRCAAHLLLDATLQLHTDDGRLAEALEITARYDGLEVVWVQTWTALEGLYGDWEPVSVDVGPDEAVDVEILATLSAQATSGVIALHVQDAEGEGTPVEVARWPVD